QQVAGEAVLGLALATPLVMLAEKGLLHGSLPTDDAEKARFLAAGRKPNSIDIGGYNVSLQAAGPLLIPGAMIANAVREFHTGKTTKAQFQDTVNTIVARNVDSFLSISFIDSMSDLFQAVTEMGSADSEADATKQLGVYLGQRVASYVPGIVQQAKQAATGGVIPERPTSFTEAIGAAIPGASKLGIPEPPPKVDVTGEIATGHRNAFFTDISTIDRKNDPVFQELDRLN